MMAAASIGILTDLGFLWFREFYLESSRVIQVRGNMKVIAKSLPLCFLFIPDLFLQIVICSLLQFPIECSLPWMLIDYILEAQNSGLLESVLLPFDIYNDSAQQALVVLRQRFLYDEIEAEVIRV